MVGRYLSVSSHIDGNVCLCCLLSDQGYAYVTVCNGGQLKRQLIDKASGEMNKKMIVLELKFEQNINGVWEGVASVELLTLSQFGG